MNEFYAEFRNLIFIVIILLVISAVVIFYIRRKPANTSLMGLEELSRLKNKNLMSPEEQKRVREAMARHYLEQEEERKQKNNAKGLSPLQMLSLQAEKLEPKKPTLKQQGELEIPPLLPKTEKLKPEVKTPKLPYIPTKLKPYVDYPEQEWEVLVQVGFLTQEDVERLKEYRAEMGSAGSENR